MGTPCAAPFQNKPKRPTEAARADKTRRGIWGARRAENRSLAPAGQVRIDDLMPDGERIAGADVPNGRFSTVRRRPGDGIIRPGELDVGTVTKCDDHGIVRADHIEPSAAARQSERIIAAQNVRAATGAIQRRRLAGTYEGCSSSFK
jgi:hypothetical protein